MALVDAITTDGTVEMKHQEYYNLMRESAKAELLMNGIKAGVPGEYLEALQTGKVIPRNLPEAEVNTLEVEVPVSVGYVEITLAAYYMFAEETDPDEIERMKSKIVEFIEMTAAGRMNDIIRENAACLHEKDTRQEREPGTGDGWSCTECGNYKPNAVGAELSSPACKACEDGSNFQGRESERQEPENEGKENGND